MFFLDFVVFYFQSEAELLVAVCVGLAQAYVLPWLPEEQAKALQIPTLASDDPKTAGARKVANTGGQSKPLSFPSEANADLKKALEVSLFKLVYFKVVSCL